jgi:hypothetical protein
MAEIRWTPLMVEERLVEAADVMRRLPNVRVPGHFHTWPPIVVEFADRVGQEPEPMRLPPPSPAAISRMEETLGWLRWLKAEHARLAWARAEGTPWKLICWRFGIARATAHRRWPYALSLIAYGLNGRKLIAAITHVVGEAETTRLLRTSQGAGKTRLGAHTRLESRSRS